MFVPANSKFPTIPWRAVVVSRVTHLEPWRAVPAVRCGDTEAAKAFGGSRRGRGRRVGGNGRVAVRWGEIAAMAIGDEGSTRNVRKWICCSAFFLSLCCGAPQPHAHTHLFQFRRWLTAQPTGSREKHDVYTISNSDSKLHKVIQVLHLILALLVYGNYILLVGIKMLFL